MKRFIRNLLMFSIFFIGSTLLLVSGATHLKRNIISFDIPRSKTILVVGDSYTECAINDSILTNAFNFSQGGTTYFHSYLKIREILEHNPHIDTIVLSYSYKEMAKSRDNWFYGAESIQFMMPIYYFLFNDNDFYALFISNPHDVLSNIPRIIFTKNYSIDHLGKYLYLERDKLQEAKNRYIASDKEEKVEYSKHQEEYLLKIYNLVRSKNIDLILQHTPIHPFLKEELEENKYDYYSLAEQKLPKAKIVDHSNMDIPEYGFGDLDHLNHKGARLYSEYLKKNGF